MLAYAQAQYIFLQKASEKHTIKFSITILKLKTTFVESIHKVVNGKNDKMNQINIYTGT